MKALEGVIVIDASLAEAGTVATQTLAFLGAEVYHVERPSPDMDNRYVGSIIRNSNKKSFTLDTKSDEGKEIMWKLIEKADVFFESFAPGAWNRMGFSYEEVKKRNPEIIYVSLKGFAGASDWGTCITYDPVAACSGGSAYLCGYEDFLPMLCGINVADSGTATHASMAIVMGVLYKKLTGKGQLIEIPMQNVVIEYCRAAFAEYYATGKVRRSGNTYRGLKPTAPHNIYPTRGTDVTGNYIAISCSAEEDSPDFFNLCTAMGRKDLLDDPRYATPALRYENRFALDAEISKWTYMHSKDQAMNILAKEYRVPAGAVNSMSDLCDDEFTGSHILRRMPDPHIGELHMPIVPIDMEHHRIQAVTCDKHGTGNEYVYCDFLGMSKEELEDLKTKRII